MQYLRSFGMLQRNISNVKKDILTFLREKVSTAKTMKYWVLSASNTPEFRYEILFKI